MFTATLNISDIQLCNFEIIYWKISPQFTYYDTYTKICSFVDSIDLSTCVPSSTPVYINGWLKFEWLDVFLLLDKSYQLDDTLK